MLGPIQLSLLNFHMEHMESDKNLLRQEVPGEGRDLVGGKGRGGRKAPLEESSSIKEEERSPEGKVKLCLRMTHNPQA